MLWILKTRSFSLKGNYKKIQYFYLRWNFIPWMDATHSYSFKALFNFCCLKQTYKHSNHSKKRVFLVDIHFVPDSKPKLFGSSVYVSLWSHDQVWFLCCPTHVPWARQEPWKVKTRSNIYKPKRTIHNIITHPSALFMLNTKKVVEWASKQKKPYHLSWQKENLFLDVQKRMDGRHF